MESYQRALDYLYSFINFEHKSLDRYQAAKIDADRPRRLLEMLGRPQEHFPSIHIAGTKGKGSVAAMCAACLRLAGLRVGLYTSPHLREFRERIRILSPDDADGRISEEAFVAVMGRVRPAIEATPGITWFEIVTAIAFDHFAASAVDVAVVEVGLGGRLDATNVLTPLVSVITSLSLDHTQLLGDTLAQIAAEKGGIIKPGVPVVTAAQAPEALATLEQIAAERGAPLTVVGHDWPYEVIRSHEGGVARQRIIAGGGPQPRLIPPGASFVIGLPGEHQTLNAAVALAALEHVAGRFPTLAVADMQRGLAAVEWAGRLQVLQTGPGRPTVLVDCAHNDDSAAKLVVALQEDYRYDRLMLLFGTPEDKNVAGMLARLLPLADEVVMTTANHPRSAAPEQLADMAAGLGHEATVTHSVADGLRAALAAAGPGDLVCATGSIIVVGDLLNHWDALQSDATPYG
jgi:dihydrofolate synthase/folylpolyglutamate synthase